MEYREEHPEGFGYSWFCGAYRRWAGRLDLVMRGEHRAGEKLFVDFAGQTLAIVDPETGEVWQAQLFVAVLGASNYTYAEAFDSQALPDWIAGHVHAFTFFGGCTRIVVPDNLRSAVSRAHRYEPELNRTYAEMATHYGCAVIPARPRKPRDKAKVENGVLQTEAVSVLVGAALPGTVRVAEVDLDPGVDPQLLALHSWIADTLGLSFDTQARVEDTANLTGIAFYATYFVRASGSTMRTMAG